MTESILPPPPKSQKELLQKFVQAVLSAPHPLALTATRDPKVFWERHVLDALKVLALLPMEFQQQSAKALDVGSGNGIPGIPVAVAMPKWRVDLLDSNNKKCGFLDAFCNINGINNVQVLAGRAEKLAHESCRETYDVVFARALGKLPTAIELVGAFAKIKGLVIVPHGTSWKTELNKSQRAMVEMGLALRDAIPYKQGDDTQFTALIFEKYRGTPDHYPRAVGIPTKRPL